jgi:PPM family protein phosphatase
MEVTNGSWALVDWAAGSTTGQRRSVNEDAFGVDAERGLFVVADGCGGSSSGRAAADIAVKALLAPDDGSGSVSDPLARRIGRANAEVFRRASTDPTQRGMGCAVVALRLARHGPVALAHAGDCRGGRLDEAAVRGDEPGPPEIAWLTQDHTLQNELRDRVLDPDVLASIPDNVIVRAVGVSDHIDVDVRYHHAPAEALFILCSDGVHQQVDHHAIARILSDTEVDLAGRCRRLLQASEDAGGSDNATVVLVARR